jgi:hypothetical protein
MMGVGRGFTGMTEADAWSGRRATRCSSAVLFDTLHGQPVQAVTAKTRVA